MGREGSHPFPRPPGSTLMQDRILELREQIAPMDEPPLWPA